MATPRGAVHRDIEQRFRDIEKQLRQIAGTALYRKQLNVTAGDFAVSGGGSVTVSDGGGVDIESGGSLHTTWSNGNRACYVGPIATPTTFDHGFVLLDPSGDPEDGRIWLARLDSGLYAAGFTTLSSFLVGTGPTGIVRLQINDTATFIHSQNQLSSITLSDASGVNLKQSASNQLTLYATNSFDIGNTAGGQGIVSQGANTWIQGHTTTSATANAVLSSNGLLQRSTSSARYKTNVAPAGIDPAKVLALEPKTYNDRAEVEAGSGAAPAPAAEDATPAPVDPIPPRTYVGFIAEEADALGLTQWVEYDDEGRPDSFAYPAFVVAHQAVLRDQQARIDTLEDTVASQASQLAALTARLEALENAA